MIIVTGSVSARADGFADMLAAAQAHVARSRLEDGCVSHEVAIDCEDALKLVFLERWRDMAALKAHFAQPGSAELMKAVRDHAAASSLDAYEASETAVR